MSKKYPEQEIAANDSREGVHWRGDVYWRGIHGWILAFAVGTKKQQAAIRAALKYPVEPYPKGQSQRYEINAPITTQTAFLLG